MHGNTAEVAFVLYVLCLMFCVSRFVFLCLVCGVLCLRESVRGSAAAYVCVVFVAFSVVFVTGV